MAKKPAEGPETKCRKKKEKFGHPMPLITTPEGTLSLQEAAARERAKMAGR